MRLANNQPCWPLRIKLDHPIANDLQRDAANARRLRPGLTFVDRRLG